MCNGSLLRGTMLYWERLVAAEGWKHRHITTEERLDLAEMLDLWGVNAVLDVFYRAIKTGRNKHQEYRLSDVRRGLIYWYGPPPEQVTIQEVMQ